MTRTSIAFLLGAAVALGGGFSGVAGLPRLKVSDNHRFLVQEDGKPFFWLADTDWELFHRLNREEACQLLDNRKALGFNVVQAVAIAEVDGVGVPNAYGFKPFVADDRPEPAVNDGPDNDYWDHVDYVVDEANRRGIYVGMLPTWGRWWKEARLFTPENARVYAEWLAKRYRDKGIVWILGGDRKADSERERAIIAAFAHGLRAGDGGVHLVTYHPWGGGASSELFHSADWLDFNMRQNGHEIDYPRYDGTLADYRRNDPVKPVIDGEPVYEGHPVAFNPDGRGHTVAADVRRALYWDLFNGACGHTYGHHSIWQFHGAKRTMEVNRDGINRPLMPWHEAINELGAAQMQHAKNLILSFDYFTRIPDPELLVADKVKSLVPGAGTRRYAACRDEAGTYAFVYAPYSRAFTIDRTRLCDQPLVWAWMNPRDGKFSEWQQMPTSDGQVRFQPPTPGELLDWVLVIKTASDRRSRR